MLENTSSVDSIIGLKTRISVPGPNCRPKSAVGKGREEWLEKAPHPYSLSRQLRGSLAGPTFCTQTRHHGEAFVLPTNHSGSLIEAWKHKYLHDLGKYSMVKVLQQQEDKFKAQISYTFRVGVVAGL